MRTLRVVRRTDPLIRGVGARRDFFWYFSEQDRAERRKEFDVSMKRGHFAEFNEFSKNDVPGKIRPRQTELFDPQEAIRFPKIKGTSFSGSSIQLPLQRTPFLVSIYFRDFGRLSTAMWNEKLINLNAELSPQNQLEDIPFYDISVVERSLIHQTLHSLFARANIQKNYAGREKERCMYFLDYFLEHKQTLGITNRLTNHVFLVDSQGMVRWRSYGEPAEDDELRDALKFLKRFQRYSE